MLVPWLPSHHSPSPPLPPTSREKITTDRRAITDRIKLKDPCRFLGTRQMDKLCRVKLNRERRALTQMTGWKNGGQVAETPAVAAVR